MGYSLIRAESLKSKSKEMNLPLERLLSYYVMEQFSVLVSKSEMGDRFLCMNPAQITKASALRSGNETFYYCYVKKPGENFDRQAFSYMLKDAIKYEKETNIDWSWQTDIDGDRLVVHLTADLDEMSVPITVYVREVEGPVSGEQTKIRLIMETDKEEIIYAYPTENQLILSLCPILANLELIADMSSFDYVYEISQTSAFEGRTLQEGLEKALSQMDIAIDSQRLEILKTYETSSRLNKRWKAYLKKNKREYPVWDKVLRRIVRILEPIWECAIEKEIFMGDWMPEIGKYLD